MSTADPRRDHHLKPSAHQRPHPAGQTDGLGESTRPADAPGSPSEPADSIRLPRPARSERRSPIDRRAGLDRRAAKSENDLHDEAELDIDPDTGLERRRGAGRRLSDFSRAAEEGELTPEQFLFVMAIQEFKRANNKAFPSWTDVLEVIRLLGYRKTANSALNIRSAEDWKELPDAPANVRPKGWERRAA